MNQSIFNFYPEIQPYRIGHLKASSIHTIYFEESGNPKGKPVLFVHGGPGGGTKPSDRCFFDPKIYRIVLFDQRGAGKRTPSACTEENTTWDLISDMEQLRNHLQIEQWQLFGGSWGSTLALVYAITHPERVLELILRGIFLFRKYDMTWLRSFGASEVFPEHWAKFQNHIPVDERSDLISAYYKRLNDPDQKIRESAALVWSKWEKITSRVFTPLEEVEQPIDIDAAIKIANLECHYFMNNGFFDEDNWILNRIHKIRSIPGTIIHGRYDMVCPLRNAWDLHTSWPEAKLVIVPDGGHSRSESGISSALIQAANKHRRENKC